MILFLSWPWLLAALVAAAGMALTIAIFARMNGRLAIAQKEVSAELAERRAAEARLAAVAQALHDHDEWLKAVVNASADGLIAIDECGMITLFSRAAERIFGWKSGEILGQPVECLVPDEMRAAHRQRMGNYFATGVHPAIDHAMEMPGLRKNGQSFPLEVLFVANCSLDKRLTVGVARDISERKRQEEDLRRDKEHAEETAARLRTLTSAVEQSPAAVLITDLQGAVEYANPGFMQTTGYTAEEVIGKNPRVLQSGVHPREFYERMWQTLTRGEVWRGEVCNRKKNGELYWEDATIAPVSDAGGVVTHFVAVKVDVTQRKRADEALTLAKEQAEEASRAKSQFLASMSHELRTPLNGIIGMSELLATTKLDERQQSFVEACRSSGKSLLALINDILDFSEIGAGKLELNEHDFDLGRLVQETVETMALQAGQKKIQVCSRIAPLVCRTVRGDGGRLRQLLVNLIENAIKFTAAGEITVRVEPAADTPYPGSADDPSLVRFRVTDTGIGIPADRMDRLFKSFSQTDSSTTRKYGGTGLGLAISKALVELMGGRIGVQSEPGRGSTFWFTVPLKEIAGKQNGPDDHFVEANRRESPLRRKGIEAPAETLANARVLLAEDNPINRRLAQEILRQAGMQCRTVENGRQVLEAVAGERFDLVLMDCQMPEMDGFTATQRIRELENGGQLLGHLPVIALTANAIQGDRERCLAAGMDDYVSKPFEIPTLLATMERFLAAAKAAAAETTGQGDHVHEYVVSDAVPDLVPEPALAGERDPTRQAPMATVPVSSPASSRETAIDREPPIDRDAFLENCMGNLEFAHSLLSDYVDDLPKRCRQIVQHVGQGDAKAASEVAHSLKGSAGILAATTLREVAAKIEATGKAGDLSSLVALVDRLCEETQRCLNVIPEMQKAFSDEAHHVHATT